MLRVIREVQPRFVVGENVSGLLTWNNGMVFHEIITDLENEGYETQAFLIPACATNAPHRRDRIWFVAHAKSANAIGIRKFTNQKWSSDTQKRGGLRFKFSSCSVNGTTTHTDGSEQRNNIRENIGEEREIRWGKEGDVFGELRGDGIITDTDGKRHTSYGKSKSIEGNWSGNNREQKEWSKQTKRINGLDGLSRITTDSDNGSGLRKTVQTRRTEFEELYDSPSNAADTKSIRRENALENGELERKRFRQSYQRNVWDTFPSVSPICGGDDGISTQLDGITFSKWRNESIKGYGNAVVPQVVYQIFKAIEQSIL